MSGNNVPPGTPPPSPPPPQPHPPTGPGRRTTPGPADCPEASAGLGVNRPVRSPGEAAAPATSAAPWTDGSPEVHRHDLRAGESSDPRAFPYPLGTYQPGGFARGNVSAVPADRTGARGSAFSLPQPPPFQIGTAAYLAAPSLCLSLHRRNR